MIYGSVPCAVEGGRVNTNYMGNGVQGPWQASGIPGEATLTTSLNTPLSSDSYC